MKTPELTEENRHENRLDTFLLLIVSVDLSPNTQVSSVQVSSCSLKFPSVFLTSADWNNSSTLFFTFDL